MRQPLTLNIRGKLVSLQQPKVMGIINVTPDSFYADSRAQAQQQIAQRADTIVAEGGDIIDIGACSTRPGATYVSPDEEIRRLRLALPVVRQRHPAVPVSIDTFRPAVVRMAYDSYGIDIINDVSGGDPRPALGQPPSSDSHNPMDVHISHPHSGTPGETIPEMFTLAARLGLPYILMSSKPTVETILRDFARRTRQLRLAGVKDIILDPGFGFGKTLDQNYQLLQKLDRIGIMRMPVLAAVSRKSMIYNLLHTDPAHALNGTTAAHAIALMRGASILRVHDVKEAVETVKIVTQALHTAAPADIP